MAGPSGGIKLSDFRDEPSGRQGITPIHELYLERFRYPDIVVVCDDDTSDDERVRENPILIIEVLSKSTRKKDKGEKRLEYLAIPSLLEYVLIEQDFAEIEVQRRSASWQSTYYFLGDEVVLESVNATLSVEAIYERVQNDDVLAWIEQQQKEGA